jgi:DMSO/TMAO reductase YedYZ molybdopterin-dependent catalytic subunit
MDHSDAKTNRKESGKRISRRVLMKAGFLFSAVLSLPSAAWGFFLQHFPIRTVEKNTFRFEGETGLIRYEGSATEPYQLVVDGLVEKKLRLTYRDLRALPHAFQVSDFYCVEGWSVRDVKWGGIRMEEIVKRAGPRAEAKYVIFHSLGKTGTRVGGLGSYLESMSLKDLLDPGKKCLLALDQDGKPLTHDHGAPLRLVAPFDLGYKSIKYVSRIEFASVQEPGWWTRANPAYPVDAPVPKERLKK